MAILIETKVKAFATDITDRLKKARDKKIEELKKKAEKDKPAEKGKKGDKTQDPEKSVTKVVFKYSSAKGSIKRSPVDQAENVSKGVSWTCAGAHVADKARHVKMYLTEPGKSEKVSWKIDKAFGSKEHHFMTVADFKKEWAAAMKKQGLKNYKGKDGYGDGDGFHLELPDSKIPRSHKDVQTCMDHYAKITRLEGKPRNEKFEKSWGKSLKPFIEKYEKLRDAEKLKELAKIKVAGTISESSTLVRKASKNSKFRSAKLSDIPPPKVEGAGKPKTETIEAKGEVSWDSLARRIFEQIGISPSSGFDIKVWVKLSYVLTTVEHLSQSYISDMRYEGEVIFNTPAARWLALDVSSAVDIRLVKAAREPSGIARFDVLLKTPIDTQKASIIFGVKGKSVRVKTGGV